MKNLGGKNFFTVVTVVYNDKNGLQKTHKSIAEQTCRDYEWIIIDGGSKDGTVDYLNEMHESDCIWTSEKDRGIYDAMNKGTEKASGEYIVYLNGGDNFSGPNCLEMAKSVIIENNYPELCYAGCHYRFADGFTRYRAPRRLETSIRHGLPAIHQASFYQRQILDSPPYELRYPISSDYYISARCFLKGARACYLHKAIAEFGVGGTSMQKSRQSLVEAWRIQRDVLKLGLHQRVISAIRRYAAHRILERMNKIHSMDSI